MEKNLIQQLKQKEEVKLLGRKQRQKFSGVKR
jgi:hypothetical protein